MPNVARLLSNYIFPFSMINQISLMLHNDKQFKHAEAGMKYLKNHPEINRGQLEGVTTIDGKPALPVFEVYLKNT